MGRTSQIDEAHLYGVIAQTMISDGAVSMQRVTSRSGISTGSLYHRFKSREGMLVEAWADALGAFQEAFIEAMTGNAENTGEAAALVTPQFCRQFHDRALILACCQRSQFVCDGVVGEKLEECTTRNDEMAKLIKMHAQYSSASLDACYLGIVHYPLAVVRHYLPKRRVPKMAETHVRAAYRAAMTTNED